jgi:hypothetical protein
MGSRSTAAVLVAAFALGVTSAASAEAPSTDPAIADARRYFLDGVALVQKAQWAEALSEFEQSERLHPHPVTTFNRGACERALGRYTRARRSLLRALQAKDDAGNPLPEVYASDARAFLGEMDQAIAHVTLSITPGGATISVDGRPLVQPEDKGAWLAGVSEPGPGTVAPEGRFEVELDPGAHVFTLSRKGYNDAVVSRVLTPGGHLELALELDRLPAMLRVRSPVSDALVRLNNEDLGPVPVDALRPAGSYRLVVGRSGFEDYETNVMLSPGGETTLTARLQEEHIPLTKRWWFWVGSAAVITLGAVATYALTRPQPSPQPYEGGTTGWVLNPKQ